MFDGDTVDRTIRNQRYCASFWWLVFGGFCLFWVGVSIGVDLWPQQPPPMAAIAFLVAMMTSFVVLVVLFDRRAVERIRLGDLLSATPTRRIAAEDIAAFRFTTDPREDYVELELPIPLCQLTIEVHRRRAMTLVVSFGDATRAREWAEKKGILVIDTNGYSRRINISDPRT